MPVTVELFSYFRQGPFNQSTVEIYQGATVSDLLTQLRIDPTEVGTLVVKRTPGTARTRLQSGDRVTLIPCIGGG